MVAGTARTTVVAYETGARSPTVRQLTRLLAACGLRARVVLEPITSDLDQQLDEALTAEPSSYALGCLPRFAESLSAAGVQWAVDGASAVAVQGLALQHGELAVALVDDDVSRRWLQALAVNGWDRHGFTFAPSWFDSSERIRGYVRKPVFCRLGPVRVRFLDVLPEPVLRLEVAGLLVPVLPLSEVRGADPRLAELLDRHETRLAAERGSRTV